MEEQLNKLLDIVWEKHLQTPPDRRLLIAIGGIPGSGKTTLATKLTKLLNARHQSCATTHHSPSLSPTSSPACSSSASPIAVHIPMDGFHLSRAQLSALPDPATAHARRGAEFTFDGLAFLSLVERLRGITPTHQPVSPSSTITTNPRNSSPDAPSDPLIIYAPSFDHALKDPVPDSIPVLPLPAHRIAVIEGIYVLLDKSPWRLAAAHMDLRVFVRVAASDRDVARRRLARRHLAAGIARTAEEADARARDNDLPNGDVVERLLLPVDVVLESREDESWVHD